MLGVGHRIADHVLEEDFQDRAGLLVDEPGDALHTAAAREAADGRLGDALDVVAQYLAVALGAALAQSLATLASSRHGHKSNQNLAFFLKKQIATNFNFLL